MYRWCGEVVIPPWYWRRRVRERGWYSGGGIGRDEGVNGVKPPFLLIRVFGFALVGWEKLGPRKIKRGWLG